MVPPVHGVLTRLTRMRPSRSDPSNSDLVAVGSVAADPSARKRSALPPLSPALRSHTV